MDVDCTTLLLQSLAAERYSDLPADWDQTAGSFFASGSSAPTNISDFVGKTRSNWYCDLELQHSKPLPILKHTQGGALTDSLISRFLGLITLSAQFPCSWGRADRYAFHGSEPFELLFVWFCLGDSSCSIHNHTKFPIVSLLRSPPFSVSFELASCTFQRASPGISTSRNCFGELQCLLLNFTRILSALPHWHT